MSFVMLLLPEPLAPAMPIMMGTVEPAGSDGGGDTEITTSPPPSIAGALGGGVGARSWWSSPAETDAVRPDIDRIT